MKKKERSLIYIVEDDESVRRAMKRLILSMGGKITASCRACSCSCLLQMPCSAADEMKYPD